MKQFGIYSITNLYTGDIYIGQTIRDFSERWKEHITELNNNTHNNVHFQNSWNKYGKEAFEFKIVHLCDELDNLNELEKYYIKKYNCYHNGFNRTLGGDGFVYDEEKAEMLRKKSSELSKKQMREKSEYTVKQVENVKLLLCEDTVLSIKNRIKEISKLTGVSEDAIESIKYLASWVDIRPDLNNKMIHKNNVDFDTVYDMMFNKNMTLEDISKQLNVDINQVRYSFNKNNTPYSEKNKENKQFKINNIIIKAYNEGYKTRKELKKVTGYSYHYIEQAMSTINIDIKPKPRQKIRINKEKNCDIKGISWDIKSQKWYLRVIYEGKQIFIGKFSTVEEANNVKNQVLPLTDSKDYDSILKIKQKYAGVCEPKKKIKATKINTNETFIIEGINETSRILGIPNKSISDVINGRQKTSYGYKFEVVA